MTTLALSSADIATLSADALVVATAPAGGRRKGAVLVGPATGLRAAARRKLEESLAALDATGKPGDVVTVPGTGIVTAPVVLAVGLGAGPYDHEALRRGAGSALRSLAGRRRVAVALPADTEEAVAAVAEGALLGAYSFDTYRTTSKAAHKSPADRVTLVVPDAKDAATVAAANHARAVAGGVTLARDLVNTPSADLTPAAFAERAIEAAAGLPIEIEVLDEVALAEGGYGGHLGVGRGSVNPPRLVRLAYRPENAERHLALVGKGITFDTGGISIKPSLNMHEMKGDMGGAAAALGTIVAAARLGVPVALTSYLCLAENMPSGSAQKPGDVLTTRNGTTVEVLDTDAEGRLVLADGLARAQEDSPKPDVLVDIATLTGAQVIALGLRTTGVMSNDEALRTAIHEAGKRVGETMWPMPQPEELRSNFDSLVADLTNIGLVGRSHGGMLSASIFLREFVKEGQRWAHLDIAGPSYNSLSAHAYTPRGATGVAVRTLVRLAEELAAGEV
ncbi:MAG: leucyl aminopeptidase [Frankiales bacterium]|nr:leucyl aminopeptidase [Frankiales bacterium]